MVPSLVSQHNLNIWHLCFVWKYFIELSPVSILDGCSNICSLGQFYKKYLSFDLILLQIRQDNTNQSTPSNKYHEIQADSLSKLLSGFILFRFIGRFLTQSLPPSWQLEQRIKTNNFQFTQTLSHASLFTHLRHFFCGKNPWGQNCEQSKIRPVSSFNLVGLALVKYCLI